MTNAYMKKTKKTNSTDLLGSNYRIKNLGIGNIIENMSHSKIKIFLF